MRIKYLLSWIVAAAALGTQGAANAQVVPGTGQLLAEVCDNFEDQSWTFTLNLPKASSNLDKTERHPSGFSNNGLWLESLFRGTPDFVKRVETPPGGIPGSTGALAMQTLYSGIPGRLSGVFQQDDLIAAVQRRLGGTLPVSWTPSYVTRVWVPPFENWEQRIGSSFGFRADCETVINKPSKIGRLFRSNSSSQEMEQYWPGFFFQFNGKNHPSYSNQNTATILIRSGERGQDIPGPVITRSGWWTLGMTFTPDGQVHYYGHEGVEDLTAKDHLYSNFPYGYRCRNTNTFFYNVVNHDDGKTWSTRWVVDDPKVYVATRPFTPQAQAPAKPTAATTTPATTSPATGATQTKPEVTSASTTNGLNNNQTPQMTGPGVQSQPAATALPVGTGFSKLDLLGSVLAAPAPTVNSKPSVPEATTVVELPRLLPTNQQSDAPLPILDGEAKPVVVQVDSTPSGDEGPALPASNGQ